MKHRLPIALALLLASPAFAVGLSPLGKDGLTAGPNKAFYLTVINPYAEPRVFTVTPEAEATPAPTEALATKDIAILPATLTIAPRGQRRVMVVLRNLAPGESRTARVCAQLAKQEGLIHARVCSKLSARRLAPRSAAGA